jgi:acetylornithine deacetylase/succinyl-diaminopimelate desuccinylase-like protein
LSRNSRRASGVSGYSCNPSTTVVQREIADGRHVAEVGIDTHGRGHIARDHVVDEDPARTAIACAGMANVRPLTPREKELIAEIARSGDEQAQKKLLGVTHWIDDLSYAQALERLASQPTVNIEGLVAGYTGPGGKTILPGRAVAKIDLRLVPKQTRNEAVSKLRAHLDKHGFADVELNVTGGYDPTETSEDSRIIRAQLATYQRAGIKATLNPRLAGSWPGAVFTAPPLSLPAGHFGLGHGSGAHAPDEYYVVDSSNSRVADITDATMGYVDMFHQIAKVR